MIQNRYRRIVLFFARILISVGFWDLLLPRVGLRSLSQRTRPERYRRSAAAFRTLAIQMGGVLIKVGQFLSTRVDVLPVEVTGELAGLQDEVPPAPFEEIRRVAEAEFGMPLSEKFAEFQAVPLAAASLGQAHRARILRQPELSFGNQNGEQKNGLLNVVVKIQRPRIEEIIAVDLRALRTVGGWLARYRPISRRADVPALLDEFTRILYEEIDYVAEGRNAEAFAANFKDQPGVRVPGVVWTHTTKRALTLEDVWAIKITDYEAITAAGIDRGEVASRLLDVYLKQIFEDGFFHADPHAGNLFVNPLDGAGAAEGSASRPWQLTFVDFGMVGRVPPRLREGLRQLLIGVGTQNAAEVVKSYQTMGVLLPTADLALLEKAEARIFERFWGKSMSELTRINPADVREFTSEFRGLIYSLPFQIPQNLIFLGRAVGILSGMCTGLNPSFNLFDHLAPYARKLIADEARAAGGNWLEELLVLGRSLLSVPRKMDAMLEKMERGEIAVRAPEVSQQVSRLEGALRQIAAGVVFAALLLGGIQLYLAGRTPFAEVLLAGAGLSLLWALLAGRGKA